ncbi:MAG: hypothetical protein HY066_09765 [Betaproteobacteria bacterium]|nr:hypothetical protein [Betaproteobacteria bacterium]
MPTLGLINHLIGVTPRFELTGGTELCVVVRAQQFTSFERLAQHVHALPFGRTSTSDDPAIVLKEARGTCSSKHRLLAAVARDCGRRDIQLMLGIYAMSEANTPGVGEVLRTAGLKYIPEAHCYLSIADRRYDFSGLQAGDASPFDSLFAEYVVSPDDLPEMKLKLHKSFVAAWATEQGVSTEYAWSVREACIAMLAAGTSDSSRSQPISLKLRS